MLLPLFWEIVFLQSCLYFGMEGVGPSFGVPPACREKTINRKCYNQLAVCSGPLALSLDIKSTRKAMINWLVCCGAEAAMEESLSSVH